MRIDRMLSIVVILLNKNRVSAKELADKFEVSIRTVYRDIEAINMAGIPVISYQGNNGGFGIMDNYKIDKQVLSLNDMISIVSSLRGLGNSLDFNELDSAIDKIASLMPEGEKEKEMGYERFVIDILPWGYRQRQKKWLQTLYDSIYKNFLITFTYRNAQFESTERTVEPMTLLFKGFAWYLFAYCLKRHDFRLFRLSRMSELKAVDQTFSRRKASYIDYTEESKVKPAETELLLKFSPEVRFRVEDFFGDDYITYEDDGYMLVKVSFPEDNWVYNLILGYGEYVEVLEPERIRNIIKEKVDKIIDIYNKK